MSFFTYCNLIFTYCQYASPYFLRKEDRFFTQRKGNKRTNQEICNKIKLKEKAENPE